MFQLRQIVLQAEPAPTPTFRPIGEATATPMPEPRLVVELDPTSVSSAMVLVFLDVPRWFLSSFLETEVLRWHVGLGIAVLVTALVVAILIKAFWRRRVRF